MPVFDLRNTLGLPQEAPQQPVFDRTRQFALGSPEYNTQQALQIAHQFETQAPLVRANQGLAYLGAIQNQQAQIAQQAQNLRLQQEAQMAAQRATQGLAGITPDHPEYLNQRQKVLQQNPNALLDPQFRNALNIYDQGYQQVARQRQLQANQLAAQQKQAHSLGLRAIEYGAHPDLVAEHVEKGNLGALAQMAGEARRNSMVKAKAEPVDYRTKEAYQAYLKAIQDDNPDAAAKIDEFARKGGFHWETPVAPTAATAATAPTPAPVKATPTPVEQQIDLSKVPYSNIEAGIEEEKTKAAESQAINQAWNDAQLGLQAALEKQIGAGNYPGTNYSKLRRFAEAVVNGEVQNFTPEGAGPEFETAVPIGAIALDKLGLSPARVAFSEPGNRRTGTQNVTYGDLLKTWARNYLKTAPVNVAPSMPVISAERNAAIDSVLESSTKPSK